jgi:glycogen phosphorylase
MPSNLAARPGKPVLESLQGERTPMSESTAVSSPSQKADATAASSSIQIPDELLKQYGCGPVRFSGTGNALYDRHLFFDNVVDASAPDARMRYEAAAHSIRDVLSQRWVRTEDTYQRENAKRVYYISMEFLIGRSLGNNIQNLLLDPVLREVIQSKALDWSSLLEQEPDAGLGNGGLGRLAACFLDSMATLQLPAMGYGLRYEYGIFKQFIKDGWQEERPDNWLRRADPWEVARPNEAVEVKLNCSVELREGHLQVVPGEPSSLIAIPYDRPVVGYGGGNINTLRLWAAASPDYFDFHRFSRGEFIAALTDSLAAETITRVLYPDDSTLRGEALRFLQEYFLVGASLADLVRRFRAANNDWAAFHQKVAIQLNDTHPSLAVPELMRLLLDDAHLGWDQAWDITQKTLAYTNHTLLPEALEKWPLHWFELLIPRNLEIIYEINRRFLDAVRQRFPGDEARVVRMSLIDENEPRRIRMANLAIVGSHSTNGVAAIHSRLLRTVTVKDFSDMFPERFNNKTNGVTPRRWLLSSNPALAAVITDAIGDRWITDLSELRKLTPLAEDSEFRKLIRAAKHDAKASFATWLNATSGVVVNPDTIFDSLVKRIHEYKRQLLDALRIIVLYNRLRENPDLQMPPRTFFFSGKAAPAYVLAKLIIKLINNVSAVIDNDPVLRGRLKVLFLPDYRVSLAERLIPATEVSNQISTAGYEASGTGNMKFMMNGALTIGTRDGATIEMAEEAGEENFFLFGLTAEQVASNRAWYKPQWHYDNEPETRAALDLIFSDHFSPSEPGIFAPLRQTLLGADFYMHLADLTSYLEADQRLLNVYADPDAWTRMSILNIAGSGKFSSDRTIADYAEDIWHAKPCPVP